MCAGLPCEVSWISFEECGALEKLDAGRQCYAANFAMASSTQLPAPTDLILVAKFGRSEKHKHVSAKASAGKYML